MLGPSGYGTFSYVIALVSLLVIPSEIGIPNLAVREIAAANARSDWRRMRAFIAWAHRAIALSSGVLVIVGATALLVWSDRIGQERLACMWLGLILVPLLSFGSLRDAMLRGLRKVLLGQLSQPIIRPLVLLVSLLVLWQLGFDTLPPFSVMGLHVMSVAFGFLCGMCLFLRHRPAELRTAQPIMDRTTWLRSSLPFGMTAALQLVNGRTDILAMGVFHGDADVGIYRVAVQLAAVVIFGMQVVALIQGPHIAHLFTIGDRQKLQLMITRSSQAVMLLAIVVVIVIVLFGDAVIRSVYGPQYQGAYVPLVILCIGQLVNASMGSVAAVLNMTGHERETSKSVLIGAIVNITLNLTLVPIWGNIGAATATAMTLVVWNLIMWHKARVLTEIETSPIFRPRR
jgi:O-antigen/teichoic acid export membrane protein